MIFKEKEKKNDKTKEDTKAQSKEHFLFKKKIGNGKKMSTVNESSALSPHHEYNSAN